MTPRISDVSERGIKASAEATSYFAAVIKLNERLWSPEDPEGNIVMSIAENRLTVDLIKDKLQSNLSFPDSVFFYDNTAGSAKMKSAMIGLLQHTFMKGLKLNPDNVTVSSGCGAVISNLIYCVTQPGEGIAIPAPYYPAFDFDLTCKNDAVPVAVHLSASDQPYDQQLQAASDEYLQTSGKRLVALLVTNPDNPTGTVYSEQHLLQMLKWCVQNKVHMISDEIYANSIFKPDCQFTSMAVLASGAEEHGLNPEDVKSYVHVIFGLSKDWCASGLRVGCLWTLNARIQAALQNVNAFYGVSGIAQHMIADMLEDLSFVDKYLKENKRRLGSAYDTLAGALIKAGIKFTPAAGSVFCWVDLRSALSQPTWKAERQLWEEGFVQRCGFIITPGQASHASEPGFFRICYAIVDHETILQLVQRLVGFITKSDAERQQVPLWIKKACMQKAKQEIEADPTQPAKPAFE
ncbi:TPA: hypothetical protein ACH3X2_010289 [Trebouxia sp. C0005]|nr:MAG: 1-aminocyclopropane-1-carboxylate synthase [Trebouxia sp. A1-2]